MSNIRGKSLKETLRLQLVDQAFRQRLQQKKQVIEKENPFDENKITPLMRAATQEDPADLLRLLAGESDEARASLFVKDSKGRTALDWARLVNNETAVLTLRKAMLTSIHNTRAEMVGNAMDLKERLRAMNMHAGKRLMEALKQRDSIAALDVITKNKEIDKGALDEMDQDEIDEAVTLARSNGEDEETAAEAVAATHAPYFLNIVDHVGFSALMIAANWNMVDVCSVLIDLGAKVEHTNKYGHTALTWACTVGHGDVVRLLLFHGANINHRTLEGRTGLHYACLYLKARVVSVLLDTLFERFSTYRLAHPKASFDGSRWLRYAKMMEGVLDSKDKESKRPWELLPVLPPGHHVYMNGDAHVTVGPDQGEHESHASGSSRTGTPLASGRQGHDESKVAGAHPEVQDVTALTTGPTTEQNISGNSGAPTTEAEAEEGVLVRPLSRANLELMNQSRQGSLVADPRPTGTATATTQLQESHVLLYGTLQPVNTATIEESQYAKQRVELYSSGSLSRPNNSVRAWVGATGDRPRPLTPGELLSQARQQRMSSGEGSEFFPWATVGPEEIHIGGPAVERRTKKSSQQHRSPDQSQDSQTGEEEDAEEGTEEKEEPDDFSAISMGSGSFPEWDHDTDDGAFTGLHGLTHAAWQATQNPRKPKVEEVDFIGKLFANARVRIDEWVQGAEKETELAQPVPCWLGCGFMEAVEGVAMHVRDLCPFRAKECTLCHGIYKFQDLDMHQKKDCLKRRVGCSNAYSGCNELIPFDFVYQHENLRCRYRLVPCRLACGGMIAYCKRDSHEEDHCNKRPLQCEQCHQMVHASKYGSHLKKLCPERLVTCRVSCQRKYKAKDLDRHEKEVCYRACRWGCGAVIGPEQRLQLHELIACENRPVPCELNCGLGGLVARFAKEHVQFQCPETLIKCPSGCGERLKRKALDEHLDSWHGTCNARLVRCPSNLVGWSILVVDVQAEQMQAQAQLKVATNTNTDSNDVTCVVTGAWKAVDAAAVASTQVLDTGAAKALAATGKVPIGARRTLQADGSITSRAHTALDAAAGVDAVGDLGIVLRYHRFPLASIAPSPIFGTEAENSKEGPSVEVAMSHESSSSRSVRVLEGVDRLYVKFSDRCEWLDYWSRDRKMVSAQAASSKLPIVFLSLSSPTITANSCSIQPAQIN